MAFLTYQQQKPPFRKIFQAYVTQNRHVGYRETPVRATKCQNKVRVGSKVTTVGLE
jgi:hypothetical protein